MDSAVRLLDAKMINPEVELGIKNLSEIEAACLMRVLAKPELDNMIILILVSTSNILQWIAKY